MLDQIKNALGFGGDVTGSEIEQENVAASESTQPEISDEQAAAINALQSGQSLPEGMPEQSANISPVEIELPELVTEFFALKARFNLLEAKYNSLVNEKGFGDYLTSTVF